MKDLQWFKFSPLNWMTGRIRKESAKTQIAFIELLCQYWKNNCEMTTEQATLEIGDVLTQLVKRKLVTIDGECIHIGFLDAQMVDIGETSALRSKAAVIRWKKEHSKSKQNNNGALHVHKGAMQNDADKTRQDKTREIEYYPNTQNAFEDITGNYIETEPHRTILLNKGWRSVSENDCKALLYHFLESQVDLSTQDRSDVKSHFKRWLNKRPTEELQTLSKKIHERQ